MVNFKEKTLDDKGIGEHFREAREALGFSLKDVENATRVRCKYILALENHEFDKLPETVYAKNFVRALARHYGLDADAMTDALARETSAITGKDLGNTRLIERLRGKRLISAPTIIKMSMLGIAFITVVAYFGYSVHRILKPPKLIVRTPQDSQVFGERIVALEGETEPEVELTVNQEPVIIESDGTFKEMLNLPEGISVLRVAAKKRHSKTREVYIKVVIEPRGDAEGDVSNEDKTVARF